MGFRSNYIGNLLKVFMVVIGLLPISILADSSYYVEVRQGVATNHQIKIPGESYITATITLTLQSGSLPAGLSLSSTGVLSGTPTVAGVFDAALRVRENGTPTDVINLHAVVAPPQDTWIKGEYHKEGPYMNLVTQQEVTMPFAQPIFQFGTTSGPAILTYPVLPTSSFRTLGTLVIMPGRDLSMNNYLSLARWIASWGFIVIVPDHLNPNHAESPYRFSCTYVNDMRALTEIALESIRYVTTVWSQSYRADANRIVMGGHSCGGVAAQLTVKVAAKLRGLLLLDSAPSWLNPTSFTWVMGGQFYRHYNLYRDPNFPRIPVSEFGAGGNGEAFHALYGTRARGNFSGPYYGFSTTGEDAWHTGFNDGCTPAPWNLCNSEERLEQHLGLMTRFIVPFLKYYLDDDLTVGGDLFGKWTTERPDEMLTPSYAPIHTWFERSMINDEVLVDNFYQTTSNETNNTTINALNRPITQSSGVEALERTPNFPSPWTGPAGDELAEPQCRVRDLSLSAGQYHAQSLGSNAVPLNVSSPNSNLEFEIARVGGTSADTYPVRVRLQDSNGYSSPELTVVDSFATPNVHKTALMPLSMFAPYVDLSKLTELRIVSRGTGTQRFNIDDIKITKGDCDTDAVSLGDIHTHTNPRADGKRLALSACGLRAADQTVQIRVQNALLGQAVRVFVADEEISPPVSMWGGFMVPNITGRFRQITLTATASNQTLTFNIPAVNPANTLFVQAVMDDPALPVGEKAISNVLLLRK